MSKYIFKRVDEDSRSAKKDATVTRFHGEVASDVMENVYYFLLGCSFHKNSILSAMQYVIEQHEDTVKTKD